MLPQCHRSVAKVLPAMLPATFLSQWCCPGNILSSPAREENAYVRTSKYVLRYVSSVLQAQTSHPRSIWRLGHPSAVVFDRTAALSLKRLCFSSAGESSAVVFGFCAVFCGRFQTLRRRKAVIHGQFWVGASHLRSFLIEPQRCR